MERESVSRGQERSGEVRGEEGGGALVVGVRFKSIVGVACFFILCVCVFYSTNTNLK